MADDFNARVDARMRVQLRALVDEIHEAVGGGVPEPVLCAGDIVIALKRLSRWHTEPSAESVVVEPERAAPANQPALYRCGYCRAWCSKPCGEGCMWDRSEPFTEADAIRALAAAREALRAIELCVDGLNMKGFTPKPAEKEALERIKRHCREQLLALGEENAPNG